MSQEDSGSLALREEVFSKERSLVELRTAMKEVSYDSNPRLIQEHRCVRVSHGFHHSKDGRSRVPV